MANFKFGSKVTNGLSNMIKTASKGKINTPWLQNAARSLGTTSLKVIKDISPNMYDIGSNASNGVKDITSFMRKSGNSTAARRAIANNKFVKLGQTAYKNILEDLKSGNFNNEDRATDELMKGAGFGNGDSGVGFDDWGMEEDMGGDTNIQIINNDSGGSQETGKITLAIDESMRKSTMANIEAQQATLNTYITMTSQSMLQHQESTNKIVTELANINNSIQSLVEFNTSNMSNFITTATSFMEKVGRLQEEQTLGGSTKTDKANLFAGKIDLESYTGVIKDQFNTYLANSPIGMMKTAVGGGGVLEALAANPLGMISEALVAKMMPEDLKKTMAAIDQGLADFFPSVLSKIATTWGGINDQSPAGLIKGFIGKVFGVTGPNENERNRFTMSGKITKDKVDFDGVTRHSIVEVIPRYLSEISAYTRSLLTVSGGDATKADKGRNIFDFSKGGYKTFDAAQKEFYGNIRDTSIGTIDISKFGRAIRSNIETFADDEGNINPAVVAAYTDMVDKYFDQLERFGGFIDFTDLSPESPVMQMISKTGYTGKMKKVLEEAMKSIAKNKTLSMSANPAIMSARFARRNVIKDMATNVTDYNTFQLANVDKSIDQMTDELFGGKAKSKTTNQLGSGSGNKPLGTIAMGIFNILNRGINVRMTGKKAYPKMSLEGNGGDSGSGNEKPNKKKSKTTTSTVTETTQQKQALPGDYEDSMLGGLTDEVITSKATEFFKEDTESNTGVANRAIDIMHAFLFGGVAEGTGLLADSLAEKLNGMIDVVSNQFIKPLKEEFFGTKDDNGYLRNGIFAGMQNKALDTYRMIARSFNGKGYKDSQGNEIADATDEDFTVMNTLRKTIRDVKEGVSTYLFGEKEVDENGNVKRNKENGNIVGKSIMELKSGFQRWASALFGKDDEEISWDDIKKKAEEALPTAMTGAVAGTGLGIVSGGLLGTLVGGPIGGALIGTASSFIVKSEKFQNWMFGEDRIFEDENGNQTIKKVGGVISAEIQEKLGAAKNHMIGGAAVGMGVGAFTGGGMLGMLVGGPVAGALMGAAAGYAHKSGLFHKFLYGDMDEGGWHKGIIPMFRGIFRHGDNADGKDGDLGMITLGIGGGALSAALVGKMGLLGAMITPFGPIGGALLGLAASIKASKGGFRQWLFGSYDENGNKKDAGVLGTFGNMLKVEVFGPFMNEAKTFMEDTRDYLVDKIMAPIEFAVEPIANLLRNVAEGIGNKISEIMDGFKKSINDNIIKPITQNVRKFIITPMNKIFGTLFKGITGIAKLVIGHPFRMLEMVSNTAHFINKHESRKKVYADNIKEHGRIGGFIENAKIRLHMGGAYEDASHKYLDDDYTDYDERKRRFKEDRENRLKERKANRKDRRRQDYNRRIMGRLSNYQLTDDTVENRAKLTEMLRGTHKHARFKGDATDIQMDPGKPLSERAIIKASGNTKAPIQNRILGTVTKILNVLRGKSPDGSSDSHDTIFSRIFGNHGNDGDNGDNGDGGNGGHLSPLQRAIRLLRGGHSGEDIIDDANDDEVEHHADGGEIKSGVSLVGERGPELVINRQGSMVYGDKNPISVKIADVTSDANLKFGKVIGDKFGGAINKISSFFIKSHRTKQLEEDNNDYAEIKKKGSWLTFLESKKQTDKVTNSNDETNKLLREGNKDRKKSLFDWLKTFDWKKGALVTALLGSLPFILGFLKNFNLGSLFDRMKDIVGSAITQTQNDQAYNDANRENGNTSWQDSLSNVAGDASELMKGRVDKWVAPDGWDHESNSKLSFLAHIGKAGYAVHKGIKKAKLAKLQKAEELLAAKESKASTDALLKRQNLLAIRQEAAKKGKKLTQEQIENLVKNGSDDLLKANKVIPNATSYKDLVNGNKLTLADLEKAGINTDLNLSGADITNATRNGSFIGSEADDVINLGESGKTKLLDRFKGGLDSIRSKFSKGGKDVTSSTITKLGEDNIDDINRALLNSNAEKLGTAATGLSDEVAKTATKSSAVSGLLGGFGDDLGRSVATTGASLSDDVARGLSGIGAKAGASYTDDIAKGLSRNAEKLATKGTDVLKSNSSAALSTLKSALERVVGAVSSFVAKKGGKLANAAGLIGKMIGAVKTKIGPFVAKLGKLAGRAATFLVSEAGFITLGALNGATGAGRLFQINDPDPIMIAIAGVLGGFRGSTIGSICDIANEIAASVIGIDFFHELASMAYNAVAGPDKYQELLTAKDQFKGEYEVHKEETMKAEYNNFLKMSGKSPSEYSFEQYKEDVKSGRRKTSDKGFLSYNDERHQGVVTKAVRGTAKALSPLAKATGKGLGAAKNFLIGQKVGAGYFDKQGRQWKINKHTGMATIYNPDGSAVLGADGKPMQVSATEEDLKEAGVVKREGVAKKGALIKAGQAIGKAGIRVGNALFGATKHRYIDPNGVEWKIVGKTAYAYSPDGKPLLDDNGEYVQMDAKDVPKEWALTTGKDGILTKVGKSMYSAGVKAGKVVGKALTKAGSKIFNGLLGTSKTKIIDDNGVEWKAIDDSGILYAFNPDGTPMYDSDGNPMKMNSKDVPDSWKHKVGKDGILTTVGKVTAKTLTKVGKKVGKAVTSAFKGFFGTEHKVIRDPEGNEWKDLYGDGLVYCFNPDGSQKMDKNGYPVRMAADNVPEEWKKTEGQKGLLQKGIGAVKGFASKTVSVVKDKATAVVDAAKKAVIGIKDKALDIKDNVVKEASAFGGMVGKLKAAYTSGVDFATYMNTDLLSDLPEDSMFKGMGNALQTGLKVVMLPSFIVGGVARRLGDAVKGLWAKRGELTKTDAFASIKESLLSGDPLSMIRGIKPAFTNATNKDSSDENRLASMVEVGARTILTPVSLTSFGLHRVIDVFNGIKHIIMDEGGAKDGIVEIAKDIKDGNPIGVLATMGSNIKDLVDPNKSIPAKIGGLVSNIVGVPGVAIAGLVRAGKTIGAIINGVKHVIMDEGGIKDNIADIGNDIQAGNPIGVLAGIPQNFKDIVDPNKSIPAKIGGLLSNIVRIPGAAIAGMVLTGKTIGNIFNGIKHIFVDDGGVNDVALDSFQSYIIEGNIGAFLTDIPKDISTVLSPDASLPTRISAGLRTAVKPILFIPTAISSMGHSIVNIFNGIKNILAGEQMAQFDDLAGKGLQSAISGELGAVFSNYSQAGQLISDPSIGGKVAGISLGITTTMQLPVAGVVKLGKSIGGLFNSMRRSIGEVFTGAADGGSLDAFVSSGDIGGLVTASPQNIDSSTFVGKIETFMFHASKAARIVPTAINAGKKLIERVNPITMLKDSLDWVDSYQREAERYKDPSVSMDGFNSLRPWKGHGIASSLIGPIIGMVTGLSVHVERLKRKFIDPWADKVKAIGDGVGGAVEAVKAAPGNVANAVKAAPGNIKAGFESGINNLMNLGRGGHGGRGGTDIPMPYYSQNDPRWKNKSYGDETMGDAGCGPDAMAMVASSVGNRNGGRGANEHVLPTEVADYAKSRGYRDDTGTNWNFVDDTANRYGMKAEKMENPSSQFIKSQITSGNPVILSGKAREAGTPFTTGGHYVVASGVDGNGNIKIRDPRSKAKSGIYDANTVVRNADMAWGMSNSRKSSGKNIRTLKMYSNNPMGGRGQLKASDVVNIAKNEIGYLEKRSNAQLDDKTANAGSSNYTKYGRDTGHGNGQFWCATFVTWVFQQACNNDKAMMNAVLHGATSAMCSSNADAFKRANKFVGRGGAEPKAGWVIFFNTGRGTCKHTGIVAGTSGNTVYTIEGNTSAGKGVIDNGGGVASKSYDMSNSRIYGYGVPDLDTDINVTDLGAADGNGSAPSTSSTDLTSTVAGISSALGVSQAAGPAAIVGDFFNQYSNGLTNYMMTGELKPIDLSGSSALATALTGNSGDSSSSSSSSSTDSSGTGNATSSGTAPSDGGLGKVLGPLGGKNHKIYYDFVGRDSAHFETGDKGPWMISSGAGDLGGASFGNYQLITNKRISTGLWDFWNKYGYKAKHPGVEPGNNAAFKKAWVSEVDANVKQFMTNEHEFAKDTLYDPARVGVTKKGLPDANKRSRAIQELTWAWGNALGPGFISKYAKNVGNTTDDATAVKKWFNYVYDNVPTLYKSSPDMWKGMRQRARDEGALLSKYTNTPAIDPNGMYELSGGGKGGEDFEITPNHDFTSGSHNSEPARNFAKSSGTNTVVNTPTDLSQVIKLMSDMLAQLGNIATSTGSTSSNLAALQKISGNTTFVTTKPQTVVMNNGNNNMPQVKPEKSRSQNIAELIAKGV